jgi:hypothetical protein
MVTSRTPAAAAILDAMDLTARVFVVLGCAAGAVAGAMVVVAALTAAGTDGRPLWAVPLLVIGAVAGAVIGKRANEASARALAAERAADFA